MNTVEKKQVQEFRELEQLLREEKKEFKELRMESQGTAILPTWITNSIVKKMAINSPVISQATMFFTDVPKLRMPIEMEDKPASFREEFESLEEESYILDHIDLEKKRIAAAISITKGLLYGSDIDIVKFASEKLARKVSKTVEASIFTGDGSETSMHGILNEIDVLSVSGESSPNLNNLNDLINKVQPVYQVNAAFYMSTNYFNKVSNWTDSSGRPMLETIVLNNKIVRTLFGFPVYQTESLTAENPVVFMNPQEAYALLVQKNATIQRVQADTAQAMRGSELIYFDTYMDGRIYNKEAVAKLSA
ncbi:HK97 family phage major capsid protein [Sinobaca qinghaiensis]|uniref:HK97 family phage major capsid protein n=1 Tax=Sinobaca qinghaiensis TaxID=342944 RepID=A0A419VU13_9BACL|nr:phage major capsid protein [Sinobaca qinghaiensis]RKD84132.1 HK97 family phage major capsid protein [Sinobaca qinghaiensis]